MRKIKFIFLFAFCFLCASCVSRPEPEVYSKIDYTEDDAVNDEIKKIKVLSSKDSVKAFWRSSLVRQSIAGQDRAEELYSYCRDAVFADFEQAVNDKDYFKALSVIRSVKVIDKSLIKKFSVSEEKLFDFCYKDVPGLSAVSVKNAKVSDMIKGTVTVYVDKGIKVEKGIGTTDAVLGSGFFISKDGYIVTNHHVISDMVDKKYEGFSRLYIKLAEDSDTRIPAKVVGWDSTIDLALLKTEIDAPYVFELGNSRDLNVGDRIYAIGSPLGLDRTITSGIVSALDRNLFTTGPVFQIDAAVNSGNSGGPLIDEKGRVQAVVFAGVQNYQGLNFAIPVEYLKAELPFLYRGGERKHPCTGSYGKTKKLAGSGAVNEGLTVNYVLPGSSADLAGLKESDVITGLDGFKITCIEDMSQFLMQYDSGTVVALTVTDTDGETSVKNVYLEERPKMPGYEVYRHDVISQALYPILGMKLVNSSSLSKKTYNIVSVLKGSIADEAGFSENDPVQITDIAFSDEKEIMYVQLYAKKRKNGYLDIMIALPAPLDSPYYF